MKYLTLLCFTLLTFISQPTFAQAPVEQITNQVTLSHQQEVWLYALEWCESRGVPSAINKVDLDGTSSYYSFQFKPSTFLSYGSKYGIVSATTTPSELSEKLKSYDLQKQIVSNMILDKSVKWKQQFPDCVRKNGFPPR